MAQELNFSRREEIMATQPRPVEIETSRLIDWFRQQARENDGVVPPFTNADVISELRAGTLKNEARAHGNIQSRVDFACYRAGLPPLGLTADAPFRKAWAQQTREWAYPVEKMQAAAQSHDWRNQDFVRIQQATTAIPLLAKDCWIAELTAQEASVRDWAESFNDVTAKPRRPLSDPTKLRVVWSRDELILALDQYLKHKGRDLDERDPEIVALSDFLNRLGAVLGTRGGAKFRNPNGVAMKLMNFRRHDPRFKDAGKRGLTAGNRLEGPVWDEYANDAKRLAEAAAAIRATVENYTGRTDLSGEDESDITEAPEGKLMTRLHRSRERSRKLVEQAKVGALRKFGRLSCAGCEFEFKKKYGEEAAHIIDCHHTKPVSTLAADGGKTHIDDLVLLCPNCHRVVHSRRPWLSLADLRERITGIL